MPRSSFRMLRKQSGGGQRFAAVRDDDSQRGGGCAARATSQPKARHHSLPFLLLTLQHHRPPSSLRTAWRCPRTDRLAASTQLGSLDPPSLSPRTTPPSCPDRLHHHLPLRRQALLAALPRRPLLLRVACHHDLPPLRRKEGCVHQDCPYTLSRDLLLMTQTGSTTRRYPERRTAKESHANQ